LAVNLGPVHLLTQTYGAQVLAPAGIPVASLVQQLSGLGVMESPAFTLEPIHPGMAMEEGYLRRTGYRLPTEVEWEYACRAEALTSRYYGATDEMLPRYAWYSQNSRDRAWPVGQKKPNDFGFFDMHGNVWEWCQNGYGSYPQAEGAEAVVDSEDKDNKDAESRLLRGGSFFANAVNVRSALRYGLAHGKPYVNIGFRPARTYR
jgi:formylglycine-generating enzyme required for sulfatase activity